MSVLLIDAAGPATSVQDGGRFGTQRYGLPPSGAMDRVSLAVANVITGNKLDLAAIEIGPLGARFTVNDGPIRVALAGATRTVDLGGMLVPIGQSVLISDGETLTLGPARAGVFSYLAIEGGIAGEPVFGSLSVNARAGLGSPYPRPLIAGDRISVSAAQSSARERAIDAPARSNEAFRVVLGPQDDEFGASRDVFLQSEWRLSAISDRMGYRLEGPKILHEHGHNIVSDGTVNGSIQVPGSGQPIVLMMDRGTSGGYPKIATVISADLGRFAQTPAGSTIRFTAVSIETAQAELRKMEAELKALPSRVRTAAASHLNIDELQNANVAGAAVNAIDTATWQTRLFDEP